MTIAPSLLAARPESYAREIDDIARAGAGILHIDVMDGHFVPNLSFGPDLVHGLRPLSNLIFDVHLMVERPSQFMDPYIAAGADILTVHVEAADDITALHRMCVDKGIRFGLALRPDTPVDSVRTYAPLLDLLLIMGVYPGFGGQKLLGGTIERIRQAVKMRLSTGAAYQISVDGGICAGNAASVVLAGADILVAGSAVFGQIDRTAAIAELCGHSL